MFKIAKNSLGVVGVASMLLLSPGLASAAYAQEINTPVAEANQEVPAKKSTEQIISEAKSNDSAGFQQKLKVLKTSSAFLDVVSNNTGNPEQALEFYAAISTSAQIQNIVDSTRGKHFVVTGTKDNPEVTLVEGAPVEKSSGVTTYALPTCVRGWAAAAAYFAATGMTCGPLHLVGGVPGLICDGVFFTAGMLPDFNSPC